MHRRKRGDRWIIWIILDACVILTIVLMPCPAVLLGWIHGPLKIEKVYFMIHPTCWADVGPKAPEGKDQTKWTICFEWEKEVNERQKEFIKKMKSNEALIIFPVGSRMSMLDLQRHARNVLGRRCIIMRRNDFDPPDSWTRMNEPIKHFLEDRSLDGKPTFLQQVPRKVQAELAAEIHNACKIYGYNWSTAALEIIYSSRICAMEIKREFGERGLHYDPATVESEAFGEGFEECAMTLKAMLVPYLGFAKPADSVFELSVSGAVFLRGAEFKERIKLDNAVRLFLWQRKDGRPIGAYVRSWCRLKDPQYYAHVPLKGMNLEAWGLENYGSRLWPAEGSSLKIENGCLKVPVLNAIRRDSTDGCFYLIADDMDFDEFREHLINNVTIRPD